MSLRVTGRDLAFVVEVDGKHYLDAYAKHAQRRLIADAYYLARFRALGPQQAALQTCARYGHDVRGGLCERCGKGVDQMRLDGTLPRRARPPESRSIRAPVRANP